MKYKIDYVFSEIQGTNLSNKVKVNFYVHAGKLSAEIITFRNIIWKKLDC